MDEQTEIHVQEQSGLPIHTQQWVRLTITTQGYGPRGGSASTIVEAHFASFTDMLTALDQWDERRQKIKASEK